MSVTVAVNSIGGPESRAAYRAALIEHLKPRVDSLSDHAKKRLEDNPLRILDSKDPRDKAAVADAPSILDALTDEDRQHWQAVLRGLDALKTPIPSRLPGWCAGSTTTRARCSSSNRPWAVSAPRTR